MSETYSAGEEKSPNFLFHGGTALHKILKFQGETANLLEKFQGEITEFLKENMELYRQNLKRSRFMNAYNRPCLLAINQTLLTPATYNLSACLSLLLSELAHIFWIYGACLMI